MDKKEALKILIEHTSGFPEDKKREMIDSIPQMPDADIDALGRLLGSIKQDSIDSYAETMKRFDEVLGEGK